MKKLAFLEYAFIFGGETFDNLYDFEKLLSQVFKAKGFEAQVIDAVRGSVGRRVVLIKRIESAFDKPIGKIKDFNKVKKVNI